MTAPLNLRDIERRAFRSTYQDGLWDIYYGVMVMLMGVFIYRPATGYRSLNIFLMLGSFLLAYEAFKFGKKHVTAPRLGMVKFGEIRRKKSKKMGIILGAFIFCQLILIGITAYGWNDTSFSVKLNRLLGEYNSELLLVSTVASLIVGTSMIVIVSYSDFNRGYYIAVLMALAVFLMLFFNLPILAVLIGLAIFLPGIVLLIRFIRRYPVQVQEVVNE